MSRKSGKTKEAKEAPSYEIRDIVLGKVRGFPPWPGMVVDPDSVPPAVQKERPGGKKNTFYCVRFFPAGDYSWLPSKELSKLHRHEIEAYRNDPHKKSGDLLKGYEIALDPGPWETEKKRLADEFAANEQAESSDEDQLASESDGEGSASSKKRKRSDSKKTSKKGGRGKGPKKSKATVESEDDGEGEDDDEEKPAAKKAKTNKGTAAKTGKGKKGKDEEAEDPEAAKVKDWRHKLQKAFLSNKEPDIKAEDMPIMDELFKEIEAYQDMTIQSLQVSKIGKVMKHINSLADDKIPSENIYHFKARAQVLIAKWHVILTSNNSTGSANGDAAPSMNGTTDTNIGDVSMMTALPDMTMEEPQL